MGSLNLTLVLVVTVVLLGVLLAMSRTTRDTDERLDQYTHKVFAREAAATGLNLSLGRLGRDTTSWAASPASYGFAETAYQSTTFEVNVLAGYAATLRTGKCNIDTVDVISTGQSRDIDHVIEATIVRTCSDTGAPPGEKYAMASDNLFKFNGSFKLYSATDSTNANLHTNDILEVNGNENVVQGYGTYVNSYTCDNATCSQFQPNDDTNGADMNVYQSDSVHIPTFVAADYQPMATYMEPGSVEISSSTTYDFTNYQGITGYGTADNPFLWYIPGDLKVTADFQVLGHVKIVVEGHVHLDGEGKLLSSLPPGVTPPPSSFDNPNVDAVRSFMGEHMSDGTTLGIFVDGSLHDNPDESGIHLLGKSIIAGQLFANHTIHVSGEASVFGGMTSKSQILMNGKNIIWHAGANESIALQGQNIELPNGIRLIAYSEW